MTSQLGGDIAVPGEICFNLNRPGVAGRSSNCVSHSQTTLNGRPLLANGKKTKGRVKVKMEFIDNKLRRFTTFSKRKTGIMKKAYELATLTGAQVMLLVASETGNVYTFATKKLQPMITSESGKSLIQACLNSTEDPSVGHDSLSAVKTVLNASKKKRRQDLPSFAYKPDKINSKHYRYNDSSYSLGDLPTMVQPMSILTPLGSTTDEQVDDGENDETVLPVSPLLKQEASETKKDLLNSMMCNSPTEESKFQINASASNLFPFSSSSPFVYCLPQGLVYVAPAADGTKGGSPQSFMIGSTPDSYTQTGQQQFVSIPLPMGLTQPMFRNIVSDKMSFLGEESN